MVGDGEKYLAALIQIDFENVGKWATDQRLAYTNFKSLARLPEVRELIAAEVDEPTTGSPRWSRSAPSGSSTRSWTTTTTRSPPP